MLIQSRISSIGLMGDFDNDNRFTEANSDH
jgi:hypothetical protein